MSILILLFTLVVLVVTGTFTPDHDFDERLESVVEPYDFSVVGWEVGALWQDVGEWFTGTEEAPEDEVRRVTEFFTLTGQIKTLRREIDVANAGVSDTSPASIEEELNDLLVRRTEITSSVESIIGRQIKQVLTEQGIYNPLTDTGFSFPPVNFTLGELPDLLVISPRERIESIKKLILNPGLSTEEKEEIEAGADGLDVSSLVVGIGGIATYPTMVDSEASLRWTIDTIVEEWVHQYLVFKPLGFRYVLDLSGIARNYQIATMNESLAGIVSKEIGNLVYERYYSDFGVSPPEAETESGFDFNQEMREIRKQVDAFLEDGEIERAEEYMEQQRLFLASNGYHIRKLNQAFFAFHGTYAHSPAYISPIGLELRELRESSDSLKGFLNKVALMTSRDELSESIR